ncbi:MAG: HAMP domain-containing histidine kinase [Clostridia bacterium]|nr:HAMP domain-containing histidine kinase [Clostridia bacterium]
MKKKLEKEFEKLEKEIKTKIDTSSILGIRTYYWMAILIEFFIATGLSLILIWILDKVFNISDDTMVPVFAVLMCSTITAGISFYLNRWVLSPIRKLGGAMRKVAAGDFKIQVPTKSKIRDMEEINSNFNLMVRALDATEVLQSDFVSNVSHEFKTPITAIEGYAMLLQGTPDMTEEQQEYVDKILLNTQRLSGLIGNVLLLSKIENQQIPESLHTYRLDEQIRKVLMLHEMEWTKKNIDLDVDMEDVVFSGNESLMAHVWDNLISNAVKFNSQGGLLRLRLRQEEGRVIFTVEDEGPGISQEDQAHIFDKFYQADSSHKQEGNGLGLSLVKRIITACNGEITVENRKEGGARFTVVLPQE